MITSFHAKYFAHELTRRHGPDGIGRLSQSLFDASVQGTGRIAGSRDIDIRTALIEHFQVHASIMIATEVTDNSMTWS